MARSTVSFTQLNHAIQCELFNLLEFRKTSSAKRRQFAVDISLVALSIRTAYLVEIITPKEPVKAFSQLIINLRQNKYTSVFKGIFHLYEPCSNQSFFVNTVLIRRLLDLDAQSSSGEDIRATHLGWPSFVRLEDPATLLTAPPKDLLVLLRSISLLPPIPPTLTIASIPPPTQTSTIPLAGLLLEYPVAYVPTSPHQTLFLSRVPLDVYEFVLSFDFDSKRRAVDNLGSERSRHTLLKFSCPRGLDIPTEGGEYVENFNSRFLTRLQEAGLEDTVLLHVDHHTEILDQVGL